MCLFKFIEMFKFLTDVILHSRFKKKINSQKHQSKEDIKTFKSMVVIISQESVVDEKVFLILSEMFNISIKKITIIVFSNNQILKINSKFKNRILCSRKDLGISGIFPQDIKIIFEKKFDLLVNYFDEKDIFPELISLSLKSKLRIGFFKANHNINDIILDISPDQTDLFLNESKNYLNAFLK